jgi:hypothetical protein
MNRNLPAPVRYSALIATILLVGCGKSDSGSQIDDAAQKSAAPVAGAMASAQDINAAKDAVSEFLDAIRRGGDSNRAHQLLTSQATKILEGLGRTIQPIGSPDATFEVSRSEAVAEHPGMALVHSTWSEPAAEGPAESYQVVWAMQFEKGWKISGMAMEFDPTKPPMIVDFEDAAQMAELFREQADTVAAEPATPAAGVRTAEAGNPAAAAPAAPAGSF